MLLVTLIQVQALTLAQFKLRILMGDHLAQLELILKLLVAPMVHPMQTLNHWQVIALNHPLPASLLLLSQFKVIMEQQLETLIAKPLQPLSHHMEAQVEQLNQLDQTLPLLKLSQATHTLPQQFSPLTKDPTANPKVKEIP